MKKRKGKIIFLTIIVLILVGLGSMTYFISLQKAKGGGGPFKASVVAIYAYNQLITDENEALGTAFANESVDITPNVTEKVKEINFIDNQFVSQGDVIVVLEHSEEIAQKKAEELRLMEHKRELKRLKTLLRNQAVTKRQYDERETLLKISQENISEIDAKIQDRVMVAPFSGVLGLRNVSVGSLVSPGDLITTLDDINSLKIDFSVPSLYLSQIYPAMPLQVVTEAFPNEVFEGQIAFIDSRVDRNSRSIKLRAIIENKDLKLKPGLLMKIKILSNERLALLVPEDAIVQSKNEHFLYVIDAENVISKRRVEIGTRKPGFVEILSGIDSEELVAVRGVENLSDGIKVTVKEIMEGGTKEIKMEDNNVSF